jgi:hypothetical protein
MRLTTSALIAIVLALVPLVAAECSVYDPIAPENQGNRWWKEQTLTKDNSGRFTQSYEYGGWQYFFSMNPSVDNGVKFQDLLQCTSGNGDSRQFKIKL